MLKSAHQSYVPGSRTNHEGIPNRGQRHSVAHDLEINRGFLTRALNLQLHIFAALAPHILRNFIAGPIAGVLAINFYNAVAVAQTCARRRPVIYDRLNVDPILTTV